MTTNIDDSGSGLAYNLISVVFDGSGNVKEDHIRIVSAVPADFHKDQTVVNGKTVHDALAALKTLIFGWGIIICDRAFGVEVTATTIDVFGNSPEFKNLCTLIFESDVKIKGNFAFGAGAYVTPQNDISLTAVANGPTFPKLDRLCFENNVEITGNYAFGALAGGISAFQTKEKAEAYGPKFPDLEILRFDSFIKITGLHAFGHNSFVNGAQIQLIDVGPQFGCKSDQDKTCVCIATPGITFGDCVFEFSPESHVNLDLEKLQTSKTEGCPEKNDAVIIFKDKTKHIFALQGNYGDCRSHLEVRFFESKIEAKRHEKIHIKTFIANKGSATAYGAFLKTSWPLTPCIVELGDLPCGYETEYTFELCIDKPCISEFDLKVGIFSKNQCSNPCNNYSKLKLIVKDEKRAFRCCPEHITVLTYNKCGKIVCFKEPEIENGCFVVGSHKPCDLFPVGVTKVKYVAYKDKKICAECCFDIKVIYEHPDCKKEGDLTEKKKTPEKNKPENCSPPKPCLITQKQKCSVKPTIKNIEKPIRKQNKPQCFYVKEMPYTNETRSDCQSLCDPTNKIIIALFASTAIAVILLVLSTKANAQGNGIKHHVNKLVSRGKRGLSGLLPQ